MRITAFLRRLSGPGVMLLVVSWMLSAAAPATPTPTGVIHTIEQSTGAPVLVPAAGGKTAAACPGDLSHDGSRRYLVTEEHAVRVTDGDCAPIATIFTDDTLRLAFARWSVDGRRVAFWGQSVSADPTSGTGAAIFVGDLVRDPTGTPAMLTEVRIVQTLPSTYWGGAVLVSWSGGDLLTYGFDVPIDDDGDGGIISSHHVLHVVDAASSALLAEHVDVGFGPSYSPVRDELAVYRATKTRGTVRTDVFVIDAFTGRDLRQVTSKSTVSTTNNRNPAWSPDGMDIAFSGMASSGSTYHVLRIAADGRSKAVDLTPKTPLGYAVTGWRR